MDYYNDFFFYGLFLIIFFGFTRNLFIAMSLFLLWNQKLMYKNYCKLSNMSSKQISVFSYYYMKTHIIICYLHNAVRIYCMVPIWTPNVILFIAIHYEVVVVLFSSMTYKSWYNTAAIFVFKHLCKTQKVHINLQLYLSLVVNVLLIKKFCK